MNRTTLQEWFKLTDQNRLNIFLETAERKSLHESSVEKDWWVVQTLAAIFSMEYANVLVFKGLCIDVHKPFYVQQMIMYSTRS